MGYGRWKCLIHRTIPARDQEPRPGRAQMVQTEFK